MATNYFIRSVSTRADRKEEQVGQIETGRQMYFFAYDLQDISVKGIMDSSDGTKWNGQTWENMWANFEGTVAILEFPNIIFF